MSLNDFIEKILDANKKYYNGEESNLSDQEYDALKDKVKEIDSFHPIFAKVGDVPSSAWKKEKHEIPMGSLNKVHNEEEFRKWCSKFPKDTLYSIQMKMDGLSVSLKYENSKFVNSVTRGDGLQGENISPNVIKMKNFIARTNHNFTGSVRAEIVLHNDIFNKINSILDVKYSNPRNAASGISRRLDGKFNEYLSLIYYDVENEKEYNEDEKIEFLNLQGFNEVYQITGKIEEIIQEFNTIKKRRKDYKFNIDGMVIKICDRNLQRELGWIDNRPKYQIAWKFDPPGAISTLKSISWGIGKSGVLTPVANIEPVEIDGSIINSPTLHNIAEIKRLGIGIGDTIFVIKAGDIIPKITKVIEHKNIPIEFPKNCPYCNSETESDGIRLMCLSDNCSGKSYQRILHFVKTVTIDEFGESVIQNLFFNLGKIKSIVDIFKLKKEDIANIEGWGELSADKIIKNIDKVRILEAETFIASIGMDGISVSTARDLLEAYGSIQNIYNAKVEDIIKIRGFSDISANNVVDNFDTYRDEIEELLKYVTIKYPTKGKFSGLSFCFTGKMSKERKEYEKIVKENGGESLSSVTKTLSYLVCNEDKGSGKSQQAKKFGTKIITEQQFLLINLNNI